MTFTAALRQLISLRLAANGFFERSVPVIWAYLAKASVINWMLEVEDAEDVSCSVNDMNVTDRQRAFVQRGWN